MGLPLEPAPDASLVQTNAALIDAITSARPPQTTHSRGRNEEFITSIAADRHKARNNDFLEVWKARNGALHARGIAAQRPDSFIQNSGLRRRQTWISRRATFGNLPPTPQSIVPSPWWRGRCRKAARN